ncbi:hypothetical protein WA026_021076 [Henosepilachna vigintioctopunctata]|uniref:Uncharacterized protein n=1 Tax=Henosepilachna vigintioctopunctata TaxID=420089 RepID=A0AAW1V1K8_9CUCU
MASMEFLIKRIVLLSISSMTWVFCRPHIRRGRRWSVIKMYLISQVQVFFEMCSRNVRESNLLVIEVLFFNSGCSEILTKVFEGREVIDGEGGRGTSWTRISECWYSRKRVGLTGVNTRISQDAENRYRVKHQRKLPSLRRMKKIRPRTS